MSIDLHFITIELLHFCIYLKIEKSYVIYVIFHVSRPRDLVTKISLVLSKSIFFILVFNLKIHTNYI